MGNPGEATQRHPEQEKLPLEGGNPASEGGKRDLPPLPPELAAKLPAMVQAGELVFQFPESPNYRITELPITGLPAAKNPMKLNADQPLDHKYWLLHTLGHGAFGEVWLARDTVLGDHHVAIKFL